MSAITMDRVSEHHFIGSWLEAGNDKGKLLVVDLGMNEGNFSREMLARYGKARVVAAEANPNLATIIPPPRGLHCHNFAIAPENGPVSFGIDPDNSTASSLNATGSNLKHVAVEGITFADFIRKTGIENDIVDLLKIDIEGAEIELFEQTPAHFLVNVRQICVEFHAFLHPEHLPRIAKIIAKMEALDFHCIDFTTNFQDVLMVNKRLALSRIGPVEIMKISLAKYVRGAKRKLAKLV
jgi:FkbM family methyltransferase